MDATRAPSTAGQILDAIPLVGHARAGMFYARNQPERAGVALMAANRTSLVIAGAALGGRYFGPAGVNVGSVLGGVTADAAHSVVMQSPQGNFILFIEVLNNPRVETVLELLRAICMDVGIGQLYSTPLTRLIDHGPRHALLKVKSMTIKEMKDDFGPYAIQGLVLCVKLVHEYVQSPAEDPFPPRFQRADIPPQDPPQPPQDPPAEEVREADFLFHCACFQQNRQCAHFTHAMKQYFDEFETEDNDDF